MAARSARLALGGCAAVLALAACSAGSSAQPGPPSPAGPAAPGAQPGPGPAPVMSLPPVVPGAAGAPPALPGALSPAQLAAAYDTGPLLSRGITGHGQTIAIIDAYGSPTIKHDLAAFDKAWHLPAPPSFRVIAPAGAIPPFRPTHLRTGWAGEATMDVEAAHLIAPGAALLLVVAPSFGPLAPGRLPAFVRAMTYVIRHHLASVMSISVAWPEGSFPSLWDMHLAIAGAGRPGSMVTMAAGSGDYGAAAGSDPLPQVAWPASDPLVVGVGGTRVG